MNEASNARVLRRGSPTSLITGARPAKTPHLMSASDCSRRRATIAAASPGGSASCPPPPGLACAASRRSAPGCCTRCCAWGSRAAGRGAELPLGVLLPGAGCWRGGEVRPAMADCARAAAARALATRESTSSMLLAPAAKEGSSAGGASSPAAPPCRCSCWACCACCACCALPSPAGCSTACPAAAAPCLGGPSAAAPLPPLPPPLLLPGRAASCSKPLALRPVAASSASAARPGFWPAPSSASDRRNIGDSCWRICAWRGRGGGRGGRDGAYAQGSAPRREGSAESRARRAGRGGQDGKAGQGPQGSGMRCLTLACSMRSRSRSCRPGSKANTDALGAAPASPAGGVGAAPPAAPAGLPLLPPSGAGSGEPLAAPAAGGWRALAACGGSS